MLVLDLIVLIIIVSSLLFGYKKGLVNTAAGAIGFLVALILSFTLNGVLMEYLKNNTPIYSNVNNSIQETITNLVSNNKDTQKEENDLLKFVNEIKKANPELKDELIKTNSIKITNMIMKTVSFMIIYLLVTLIVSILSIMLNGIFSLPLLDLVNNFGGMALNGIVTLLKIEVILVIINLLSPLSFMGGVIKVINQTNLIKFLYDNNILLGIWIKFMK